MQIPSKVNPLHLHGNKQVMIPMTCYMFYISTQVSVGSAADMNLFKGEFVVPEGKEP